MHTIRHPRGLRAALALVLMAGTLALPGAAPAAGAPFTVTSSDDSGAGSLRAALQAASANFEADTITVQPGLDPIVLASPLTFNENSGLTLEGNGITIDANGVSSVLDNTGGGPLTVSNLFISGIGGSQSADPAAIITQGGALTVSACTLTGNELTATNGDAALINAQGGALTVADCTITDNTITAAERGAVVFASGGSVTITDSVMTGNVVTSGEDAGVVYANGGDLALARSEVSVNEVTSEEDAATVLATGFTASIVDTEVRNNSVEASGSDSEDLAGGVYLRGGSISGSDVSCNVATSTTGADAAGGVFGANDLTLTGSTVVGNRASSDSENLEQQLLVFGTLTDADSTVDDDAAGCAIPVPVFTPTPDGDPVQAPAPPAPAPPAAPPPPSPAAQAATSQPTFTG